MSVEAFLCRPWIPEAWWKGHRIHLCQGFVGLLQCGIFHGPGFVEPLVSLTEWVFDSDFGSNVSQLMVFCEDPCGCWNTCSRPQGYARMLRIVRHAIWTIWDVVHGWTSLLGPCGKMRLLHVGRECSSAHEPLPRFRWEGTDPVIVGVPGYLGLVFLLCPRWSQIDEFCLESRMNPNVGKFRQMGECRLLYTFLIPHLKSTGCLSRSVGVGCPTILRNRCNETGKVIVTRFVAVCEIWLGLVLRLVRLSRKPWGAIQWDQLCDQ